MITPLEAVGIAVCIVGFEIQDRGKKRSAEMCRFRTEALWTTGTVVRVDSVGQGRKAGFSTVFEFTTEAGTAHTVASKALTATPEFETGALVTVGYRPDAPGDAILNSALGAPNLRPGVWYGWGWLTFFVGVVVLALAHQLKD